MLEISSSHVMVKRSRGKEQQEETEKQQHVIVTEKNLIEGFTTIGNYDQKSSMLDSGVAWNSLRRGRWCRYGR